MDSDLEIAVVESTPHENNEKMHLIAKMAAGLLATHYPAHLWAVGWLDGDALAIKNMGIGGDGYKYGFTIDCPKAATISELEKAIVMGGGELLERCGVRRGAWDGELMELKDTSYKLFKER